MPVPHPKPGSDERGEKSGGEKGAEEVILNKIKVMTPGLKYRFVQKDCDYNTQNSKPMTPEQAAKEYAEMDKAIKCLALELPETVYWNISERWERIKAGWQANAYPRLIEALKWYQEIAESALRYSTAKKGEALSALIVELSNDAGRRAKEAFEEQPANASHPTAELNSEQQQSLIDEIRKILLDNGCEADKLGQMTLAVFEYTKSKLNSFSISVDELKQLLSDVYALLGGYSMDETWSDWDESVKKRVLEMQYKINEQPAGEPTYPTFEQIGGDKKWDEMTELEQANYNLSKALNTIAVQKNTIKRLREKPTTTPVKGEGIKSKEEILKGFGIDLEWLNSKWYLNRILTSMDIYANQFKGAFTLDDMLTIASDFYAIGCDRESSYNPKQYFKEKFGIDLSAVGNKTD